VTVSRYATWPALFDYCRRSANPIGRLVLRIGGYTDNDLDKWSDAICTALQLTNFWQDVKSDWARGRIYLPREEMQAHGADETALAGDRLTPEWREAIASAVSRTRALFDDGRPLCDRLRGRLRYEIRMTWLGGTRILDRIEAARFDVLNHRPTIGATDIPWLVGVTLGWPRSIPSRAATT
jgi:squalene synthase HpnC